MARTQFGVDLPGTARLQSGMAEKSLSELPRDLRALFTKGNDALQRENFDYAIDLFNQVLAREPGTFDCRRALRTAQLRRAGNGGGFFKKVWGSASSSPLVVKGQLALRQDPAEALQIAEQILNGDPSSSAAHKLVVESGYRHGAAAHGHVVARDSHGQLAQGQGRGDQVRQLAGRHG